MSTKPATSKVGEHLVGRRAKDPVAVYGEHFRNLADNTRAHHRRRREFRERTNGLEYNTALAWRRACRAGVDPSRSSRSKNFHFVIEPAILRRRRRRLAEQNAWASAVGWTSHAAPNDREHWKATSRSPPNTPTQNGSVTVRARRRPDSEAAGRTEGPAGAGGVAAATVVPLRQGHRSDRRQPADRPAARPRDRHQHGDRAEAAGPDGRRPGRHPVATWPHARPRHAGRAEQSGRRHHGDSRARADRPVDGPLDDAAHRRRRSRRHRRPRPLRAGSRSVDPMPPAKDLGVTFLGSYLSFWPMLAAVPPVDAVRNAVEGREGGIVDATLSAAALAVPGVVAALPWFTVERVILFGAEYLHSQRGDGFTGTLLADVEVDWSIDLLGLVTIKREQPLKIRYKAIGLSLTNRDGDDDGTNPAARWDFRPVFDATRGYTIDVASGGGLKIADPLGQILRVLGARLSRSNPMTLEVDIALGVDLGVVAIDQASVRAYLDEPTPPELTALAGAHRHPRRPRRRRLHAHRQRGRRAGQHDRHDRRPARPHAPPAQRARRAPPSRSRRSRRPPPVASTTGVYVGLNVVLPGRHPARQHRARHLRLPRHLRHALRAQRRDRCQHRRAGARLAASRRRPAASPSWPSPGPHGEILWKPKIDHWAFGLGILIGTMEGGVHHQPRRHVAARAARPARADHDERADRVAAAERRRASA